MKKFLTLTFLLLTLPLLYKLFPSIIQAITSWRQADLHQDNKINSLDVIEVLKYYGCSGTNDCDNLPTATPTAVNPQTWILIIQNPGPPPYDTISGFYAYDMLTKYYKYPKERIRFLAEQHSSLDKWLQLKGVQVFNNYNDTPIEVASQDVINNADRQTVIQALGWLKQNSTPSDDVIIFSFTHGASDLKGKDRDGDIEFDNDDEYLIFTDYTTGESDFIYDGEFAELVAQIKANNLFIWISACHSGGLAWDIIDRIQNTGNIQKLYLYTTATDEVDVMEQDVQPESLPSVDFAWPDILFNRFGVLLHGLTGFRENHTLGELDIDPPQNKTFDSAIDEFKDCKIDIIDYPAAIGLLDFTSGSEFPFIPAFGCPWPESTKEDPYPDGSATHGYMNRENMDFEFKLHTN